MSEPVVLLVDDDEEMLKALSRLLRVKGFKVRAYSSADEFLAAGRLSILGCLVLDVAMPGVNGLELHERLARDGALLPVIFLTGQGDIPMSVRAIKAGAVDFLTKPVDHAELVRAVTAAFVLSEKRLAEEAEMTGLAEKYNSLTLREREVLAHVITGKLNKQIAADLGTSEQTVKVHRMRITAKMGLASAVELADAARKLGVKQAST